MPSRLFDHKTISEIAQRYDLTPRTLRFYEDRGLIRPVRIGLDRFYGAADEIRLQIVLKGKRLGFTLSEIEQLIKANETDETCEGGAEGLVLPFGLEEVERRIKSLERERDLKISAIDEIKAVLARSSGSVGRSPSG